MIVFKFLRNKAVLSPNNIIDFYLKKALNGMLNHIRTNLSDKLSCMKSITEKLKYKD